MIPHTAFSAVWIAPSAQAGVHEMPSPARKMPRSAGGFLGLHEMAIHAVIVAVMARERALERAQEMRVALPGDSDGIADDVAGNVPRRDRPA